MLSSTDKINYRNYVGTIVIISRSRDCPFCGAGHSNLCFTVYDDGFFCYSCHKGSRKSEEHYAYRPKELDTAKKQLFVPPNTTDVNKFSSEVLEWLYSYYLYDEDVRCSRIAYSPASGDYPESLILPVSYNDNGQVEEYQRRFFPKAFFSSSGVKKTIFLRGEGGKLILVEDYISCLRVSKHTACACLFGTSLSPYLLSYIINNYTDVSIWLDNDEPGINASNKIYKQLTEAYSKQMHLKPQMYITDVSLSQIKTPNSAKDNSPNEIKNIIINAGSCVSDMVNTTK